MPRFRAAVRRRHARGAGTDASPWTGWPSCCASAPSASAGRSTSRRCRPARWSTRACSPPTSSGPSSPTCATSGYASAIALVHSRFSTNTFPAWPLAHPYRYVAHNGEINTRRGNRNWMRARESLLGVRPDPGRPASGSSRSAPPDASDSATFDEVLELLHLAGRSLPHAVLMMIPEAWENHAEMDPARRAFYRFHAHASWSPGTARPAWSFTDGTVIGAVLDRNGLRPAPLLGHRRRPGRAGQRVRRARPRRRARSCARAGSQPGRMFLVDTGRRPHRRRRGDQGRAGRRAPLRRVAARRADQRSTGLPEREHIVHTRASVTRRQQTFGYTEEELRVLLAPMATGPAASRWARWAPTPRSRRSRRQPRLLFDYFTQLFAQVTNPPLDAIREELVTSLSTHASARRATCSSPTPATCRQVVLAVPGHRQRRAGQAHPHQRRRRPARACARSRISGLYRVAGGGAALRGPAGARSARRSSEAIADGARIVVLSDRALRRRARADPVAAAHRGGAPPPDPREDPHARSAWSSRPATSARCTTSPCCIGYGAAASTPTWRMESVEDLASSRRPRGSSSPTRPSAT